jgi:hypothetical protein
VDGRRVPMRATDRFPRSCIMIHKPLDLPPDTIDPRVPSEAPLINTPREQPSRCEPEFTCPPDPAYTPDEQPQERPTSDPDI